MQKYLHRCHQTHASGAATDETSFYSALEMLLDAVGETLDPEVRCVMELKSTGAGNPDGGLFLDLQLDDASFDDALPLPARGAIEVKAPLRRPIPSSKATRSRNTSIATSSC